MTMNNVEIRDKRQKDWYWSNNVFIDFYGELVGEHAVAVYSVLCRHANNDTQKCFPSMDTIRRKAGMKNRKTVAKAIEMLENFNIIEVEKAKGEDGKRLNNIYHLYDPKAWKPVGSLPFVEEEIDHFDETFAPVMKKKVEKKIEIPSWMNRDAWDQWVKYRKEKKQALKESTINLQIKFLEKNQNDHVAIIERSIMNGWTGLFVLRKDYQKPGVKKVEAPKGKYANVS